MRKFPEDWMSNKDVNCTPALAIKDKTEIAEGVGGVGIEEKVLISTETI